MLATAPVNRQARVLWFAGAVAMAACGVEETSTPDEEPVDALWEDELEEVASGGKADAFGLDVPPPGLFANGTRQNGTRQNGTRQNGTGQNGTRQNGSEFALAGVDLTTVRALRAATPARQNPNLSAASDAVGGVYLRQGVLTNERRRPIALPDQPAPRTGVAYKNTFMDGVMGDGQAVKVWIEDVRQPDAQDPEILQYVIKVRYPDRWSNPQPGDPCNEFGIGCPQRWAYACGVRSFGFGPIRRTIPIPAIAVPGQWSFEQGRPGAGGKVIDSSQRDYTRKITFACVDGAIGKCALMGYRPWRQAPEECLGEGQCWRPSLEYHHEACVRMIRADYCGDGQDHTMDGIYVDVWDNAGIQTQTPYSAEPAAYNATPPTGVPFGLEAEWTPRGARCINQLLMPRTSHENAGSGMTVQRYLEGRDYCNRKWTDADGSNYVWSQDGCFGWAFGSEYGGGTMTNFESAMNTWDPAAGRPAGDPRDRVWIRNSSVCVDDQHMPYHQPNPLKTSTDWRGINWSTTCLPGG